MIKLNIGSVPEHFNMPWHLAIEENQFRDKNIDLKWSNYPGGTGDMCKALRTGDLDIAILLTEGIVKDIINGNPSKIVQTYVDSPLLWGIHVGAKSRFTKIDDLKNTKPAISRFGSGSHLLTRVLAKNEKWSEKDLNFVEVGNITGGVDALTNNKADYFLWEHFTTKPLVDNGTFRRLGNCPSPWPCFVIAIRNKVLENHIESIQTVLEIINNKLQNFVTITQKEQYINQFSSRYQLQKEDIKKWLQITEWNKGEPITEEFINNIQEQLIEFNVIEEKVNVDTLIKKVYI